MKKLLFLSVLFFNVTSGYSNTGLPGSLLLNKTTSRDSASCAPCNALPFNRGHILLVLAGCGVGLFGINKYMGSDFSDD